MDLETYFKFALALIFVLGLVLLLGWLMRRAGMAGAIKGRRLGVTEAQMVGPRHRLVLIRRDDVEHLVLIGPTAQTLIETGISPPRPAASTAPAFAALVKEAETKS